MRSLLFRCGVPSGAAFLLAAVSGCGGGANVTAGATSPAITGNWTFAASSPPASSAQVVALAGSLEVVSANPALPSTVSGVVHTVPAAHQAAASLCAAPSQPIPVTGSTAKDGTLTLTSASFGSGSVLTIRGTYDTTSRTLANAQFGIAGGSCAMAMQPMVATQYQPITGTYTGTFTSAGDGSQIAVSAQLTQTSAADANGNFSLQGTGTFAANPCLGSTVVTSSTVTGNNVTWTYTDSTTGAQVTATGSFDNTASTLTISGYTLSGGPNGCSDTGTGVLRK